jgi:hypothetical protein
MKHTPKKSTRICRELRTNAYRNSWTIVRSAAGMFALILTVQCAFTQGREPASGPPIVQTKGSLTPQLQLAAPEIITPLEPTTSDRLNDR